MSFLSDTYLGIFEPNMLGYPYFVLAISDGLEIQIVPSPEDEFITLVKLRNFEKSTKFEKKNLLLVLVFTQYLTG